MDLGGGAAKELDVACAHRFLVLDEHARHLLLVLEHHERVAGRAAVEVVHEEHAVFAVENLARIGTALEEFHLRRSSGS